MFGYQLTEVFEMSNRVHQDFALCPSLWVRRHDWFQHEEDRDAIGQLDDEYR